MKFIGIRATTCIRNSTHKSSSKPCIMVAKRVSAPDAWLTTARILEVRSAILRADRRLDCQCLVQLVHGFLRLVGISFRDSRWHQDLSLTLKKRVTGDYQRSFDCRNIL